MSTTATASRSSRPAISRAAARFAPVDGPEKMPSSRAASRAASSFTQTSAQSSPAMRASRTTGVSPIAESPPGRSIRYPPCANQPATAYGREARRAGPRLPRATGLPDRYAGAEPMGVRTMPERELAITGPYGG